MMEDKGKWKSEGVRMEMVWGDGRKMGVRGVQDGR